MPASGQRPEGQTVYRLAPGTDVVRLDEQCLVLRSDLAAVRLRGRSAGLFHDRVLPLLDGTRSLADLAGDLPDLDLSDLRRHLDELVDAGVLRLEAEPAARPDRDAERIAPLLAYVEALGLPVAQARQRLAGARVAIVGLEGPGAHAAANLVACGVGGVVLVDPYPCEPGNLALLPLVAAGALGLPREEALRRALESADGPRVEVSGSGTVSRESLESLVSGCHLVVGCFDRGFAAAQQWLNSASLRHRVPAVYAWLGAHTALVGPLVVPGRTACYSCWRLRAIACMEHTAEAVAYEESLERGQRPAMHARAVLPGIAPYAGALLGLEALKQLLTLGGQTLAGKVQEFDALRLRTSLHHVLQVPECPACGGAEPSPPDPALSGLVDVAPAGGGDPLQAEPSLVSPACGVVTSVRQVAKEAGEPTVPYLASAMLASHRLLAGASREDRACGGKGLARADARRAALGEAVERYSAASRYPGSIVYGRRAEVGGISLDPRALVLYAPEQYAELPYAPYTEASRLGWVPARSLVSGERVLVPAIGVLYGYQAASPEELLCPTTSNGLACGGTLADAVLAAAYEVLERDAFLITWMNRLPAQRIDARSHPDHGIAGLCRSYQRRGVELRLYRLAADHPCHVLLALAVEPAGDGPAAAVGLGADLDVALAARKAVLEVGQVRSTLAAAVRTAQGRERIDRLVADPRAVATMEDHGLRYADRRTLDAFDFLEGGPPTTIDWTAPAPASTPERLRRLVDHFRSTGGDLLYVNRTPADMAALGLHTVRVFVPGFQPIHFGASEPRLGGERLYELPCRLGFAPAPTASDGLNPDPHPFT
jgi:ribosomal protein S12 methylthiotransferase accessory factor